jgi:XapX domain-containing protein
MTRGAPCRRHPSAAANSDPRPDQQEKETTMNSAWQFAISLGVGVLVGVGYGLLKVRSPAPPPIALVGLLGMLLGQQLISWLPW